MVEKTRNLGEWIRMNGVAMKTHNHLNRRLTAFVCLGCALTAFSCQTTSTTSKTTSVPLTMTGTNWVKVSSRPPTYYPRGVAADCPTDHWSGEWVYTNDDKSTRYFIPLHGLGKKRDVLVREALAARSRRKMAQINAEDSEVLSRNVRNMTLAGPPVFAGILMASWASCVSGGYIPTEDDVQRLGEECQQLGKEWHETKQVESAHGW